MCPGPHGLGLKLAVVAGHSHATVSLQPLGDSLESLMRIVQSSLLAVALSCGLGLGGVTAAPAHEPQINAAAPPQVSVEVDPKFAATAFKTYGKAELEAQAERLRRLVADDLQRLGVMAGGRVELVLTDLRPSRPTRQELMSRPGLSFRSAALGGASIEGRTVAFDGAVTPVSFAWYASDISDSSRQSVWGDAERTFERFSHRLSRGQLYALR